MERKACTLFIYHSTYLHVEIFYYEILLYFLIEQPLPLDYLSATEVICLNINLRYNTSRLVVYLTIRP